VIVRGRHVHRLVRVGELRCSRKRHGRHRVRRVDCRRPRPQRLVTAVGACQRCLRLGGRRLDLERSSGGCRMPGQSRRAVIGWVEGKRSHLRVLASRSRTVDCRRGSGDSDASCRGFCPWRSIQFDVRCLLEIGWIDGNNGHTDRADARHAEGIRFVSRHRQAVGSGDGSV
jgi:hypothetical protein